MIFIQQSGIKRVAILLGIFLFFVEVTFGQYNPVAKLDSLFDSMNKHNVTMGSFVIAEEGKILYQRQLGYAFKQHHHKINADRFTQYRIGSITKTFTAVIVFQLIDAGKLNLQTKLSDFFPQVPLADKITIEMLLRHRSGLYDLLNDGRNYLKKGSSKWDDDEVIAYLQRHKAIFYPGKKFSYSNSGYYLLAAIAEKITGSTYEALLKKRIFAPLNLVNTNVGDSINPSKNMAISFNKFHNHEWASQKAIDFSIAKGYGNISSTPSDLIKFSNALNNGKLISREALNSISDFIQNDSISNLHFGKGIIKTHYADSVFTLGHTGSIDGFVSDLEYYPMFHRTLAFCLNAHIESYNMQYLKFCIQYFIEKKPFVLPSFSTAKLDNTLVGKYVNQDSKDTIQIANVGGCLTYATSNLPSTLLIPRSENDFVLQGTTPLHFNKRKHATTLTINQKGGNMIYKKRLDKKSRIF